MGRQTRIKRGAFIRVMQEVGRMAGIEFNGEMRFPKAKQVGLIVEYCEVWSEELRRTWEKDIIGKQEQNADK